MFRAVVISEQRLHPRAQIELPVRLRWITPFGYRFEISQTIDVSRTGLLLSLPEACDPGARVWVTMPFDPAETVAQPETPARIARSELVSSMRYRVALEFKPPDISTQHRANRERRRSARVFLALPVTIRPARTPWPEETMTTDISDGGMRFETVRFYSVGESLLIQSHYGNRARMGEIAAQVVHIEPAAGEIEQRAAVQWTSLHES